MVGGIGENAEAWSLMLTPARSSLKGCRCRTRVGFIPIFRGKLWLINSGTGFLGYVDLETGKFEEVTFLNGYGR